jgi:hypothetical protein
LVALFLRACISMYCYRWEVISIPLRRLIVLCRFQLNMDSQHYVTCLLLFFSLSLSWRLFWDCNQCVSRDVDEHKFIRNPINAVVFSLTLYLILFRYKIDISVDNSNLTLCSNETDIVKKTAEVDELLIETRTIWSVRMLTTSSSDNLITRIESDIDDY